MSQCRIARLNSPAILHWDMNHFVVLVDLRKSGAVLHDPARGRCRLTHAELSRHFTGVAVEITPTHEFAPRVERRRISLRALLGRPRGVRRAITEVLLLALVLEVFGIVSPWFMQLVVDHALVAEDRNLIVVLATGFLMLALIQVAVTALRGWVLMVFNTQAHLQLVSNLFRHLLRLPKAYFEKRHHGDVESRFESLNALQRTLTGSFIEAVVDGLMVIATFVMMCIYSPLLALVVCGAAMLYGAVRALWYRPLREAEEEQILRTAKQQSHFLESVRGVQSQKLFNREGDRRAAYQHLAADHLNAGIRVQRLHLVRVADVALTAPEGERPAAMSPAPRRHDIEVRQLSFRYADGEPCVLDNVNLHIAEGESVALVGPSGCGKTTLLKIMLGLLPPSEGEVRVGGVDLLRIDTEHYRGIIGTVMQDDQLFAGSIADNISFFDPEPDFARVRECAELAAGDQDILAMPMAYYTLIGDMGTALSGGQRQRLLLARALYKMPRILFLDEATSHLDIAREREVNEAIRALKLTRVIVAHRPETIASVDRVIVLSSTSEIIDAQGAALLRGQRHAGRPCVVSN